jgi:hypothetical protein
MPQYRLSVAKEHEKALAAAITTMHTPFVEFNSDDKRAWVVVDCPFPMSLKYRLALHEAIGQEVVWDSVATMPTAIVINGTPLTLMQAVVLVSVIESRAKQYHEAMRAPAKLPDPGVVDIMRYLLPVCKLMGIELD